MEFDSENLPDFRRQPNTTYHICTECILYTIWHEKENSPLCTDNKPKSLMLYWTSNMYIIYNEIHNFVYTPWPDLKNKQYLLQLF